jgi:hypothetical protein
MQAPLQCQQAGPFLCPKVLSHTDLSYFTVFIYINMNKIHGTNEIPEVKDRHSKIGKKIAQTLQAGEDYIETGLGDAYETIRGHIT